MGLKIYPKLLCETCMSMGVGPGGSEGEGEADPPGIEDLLSKNNLQQIFLLIRTP